MAGTNWELMRSAAASLQSQVELIALLERVPPASIEPALARLQWEAERAEELSPPKSPGGAGDRGARRYFVGANRLRIRRVLDFVRDGDRVLDIGAGHGYVGATILTHRRLAHYCAVDIAEGMPRRARELFVANGISPEIINLEVRSLFDLDAAFGRIHDPDATLLLEVLEHLDDPEGALATIAQVVPPDSAILFSVPLYGRLEAVWGHWSLFDVSRVLAMCEGAGLTIHHIEPLANVWSLVLASRSDRVQERAAGLPRPPIRGRGDAATLSFTEVEPAHLAEGAEARSLVGSTEMVSSTALRWRVQADSETPGYGGISFPLEAPRSIRFGLWFDCPDAVQALAVQAEDAAGQPIARWSQKQPSTGFPDTLQRVVSETHPATLRCEGRLPGKIVQVAVLIQVEPGRRGGAEVTRLAYVPEGPDPQHWQSLRGVSKLHRDARVPRVPRTPTEKSAMSPEVQEQPRPDDVVHAVEPAEPESPPELHGPVDPAFDRPGYARHRSLVRRFAARVLPTGTVRGRATRAVWRRLSGD